MINDYSYSVNNKIFANSIMWAKISRFILKQRLLLIGTLGVLTAVMSIFATKVELMHGLPKMLPDNDSTIIEYSQFREKFGEPSLIFAIGIQKNLYDDVDLFNDWYDLNQELKRIEGVDTVVSATQVYNLVKNSEEKKFELKSVVTGKVSTLEELKELQRQVNNLPFYDGILFNSETNTSIMAVSVDKNMFYSDERKVVIGAINEKTDDFAKKHNIEIHYSGLPHIRTVMTQLIKSELGMFVALAFFVTILILFFFFRSVKPVAISILVVAMGVVWALGTMAILGFKLTVLSSIIPPLVIVIGIPNCIFLINKYHSEYRDHGNKAKALSRVIQKIGRATLLTNATTAVGFLTFIFTNSTLLIEFGIIASISILNLFVFSILVIPISFSYLSPPSLKHTNHLDYKWVNKIVDVLIIIVKGHRTTVYWIFAVAIIISCFGISHIKATGNLVDDLPMNHKVRQDLKFFEDNFSGVMPFNIYIDAKKPREVLKTSTLKRMEKLQELFATYPFLSKPFSIVDGIKFTRQAFYGGNPKQYRLINSREKAFFKPYIGNASDNRDFLKSFIDTSQQYARVNVQIADLGTYQMDSLLADLGPKIDSILPPEKYDVKITGESIVYLAGTKYMVKNLFISLFIAIIIVGLIMALLFSSLRMILISIATNLIPLILTAGMMGYFGINIKPSTILVFSIAFGISVDDTIHFLAKFRQELTTRHLNIGDSVLMALREIGVSMFYTSVILFFGFSVFDSSQFGGTQALGVLVSFTLLVAMISNLIFLPSMLLTLEKKILTKAFKEPYMDIYDEEEDIELNDLTVVKGKHNIQ